MTDGLIRPHSTKLELIQKLSDAVIIVLSYAMFVRLPLNRWSDFDSLVIIIACAMFHEIAKYNSLYSSWRVATLGEEIVTIFMSWFATIVAMIAVAGLFDLLQRYSVWEIWQWMMSVPIAVSTWHVACRLGLRSLRKAGYNTRSVAIVGETRLGLQLAEQLSCNSWMGLKLKGFYEDRRRSTGRVAEVGHFQTCGDFNQLIAAATAREVDVVFIAMPFQAEKRITQLINELRDTTAAVYFAQDFRAFEILHGRSYMLGNVPLISVHENPHADLDGVLKRLEDIVLGSLFLLVAAVPALLIAVAIKLTSPGSVLFVQRRYGLNGEEIRVLKFRTMYVSEDGAQVRQATCGDARVTPLGRFLRRTSLDELPQFINVLQGSMSIVGPRPHAVAHNEHYRTLVKSYMLRHKVKPGITGLAQINGCRGETATVEDMERRVEYDLQYIRSWSILLDLKIIVATVLSGFANKEAY